MDFKKRVYFSTAIICGSFIVFVGTFYFLESRIDFTANKIMALREASADRAHALDNLSILKAEENEADELSQKMDALLPPQDSLLSFNQFIEARGRVHDVDADASFAGLPTQATLTAPGSIQINMSVVGPSTKIIEFLNDIEFKTSKYLISIDNLTFVPDGLNYRADIIGKVFFK